MLLSTLALPLLLQVGPAPSTSPVTGVPEELYEQRRLNQLRERAEVVVEEADPVRICFDRADSDPDAARFEARGRFNTSAGLDRAVAGHCLGYALSRLDRWDAAAEAFLLAKDAVPDTHGYYRTRLGAALGAARLAAGQPERALAELNELDAGDNGRLAGAIALDRARAHVMLGRTAEADTALAEARKADSSSAEAWLLSATLARRLDRLEEARSFIEQAALLRPADPDIGLEEGVIAVLSGRDEVAILRWQSVAEVAPGTQAALTARQYLAQLRGE